jgi:hypothetical protein
MEWTLFKITFTSYPTKLDDKMCGGMGLDNGNEIFIIFILLTRPDDGTRKR